MNFFDQKNKHRQAFEETKELLSEKPYQLYEITDNAMKLADDMYTNKRSTLMTAGLTSIGAGIGSASSATYIKAFDFSLDSFFLPPPLR